MKTKIRNSFDAIQRCSPNGTIHERSQHTFNETCAECGKAMHRRRISKPRRELITMYKGKPIADVSDAELFADFEKAKSADKLRVCPVAYLKITDARLENFRFDYERAYHRKSVTFCEYVRERIEDEKADLNEIERAFGVKPENKNVMPRSKSEYYKLRMESAKNARERRDFRRAYERSLQYV